MTRFTGSYVSVFPWFWVLHIHRFAQDEEGDWSWPQGKTAEARRMIEDIPGTVPEVRISQDIL